MPTTSGAKRPRRLGRETQQELISRDQFCEQIAKQGWRPVEAQLDLGEDLNIHTCFDGRASGVSEFFQLKRKQDWSNDILTDRQALTHRFDVKDLEDWESLAQPCILVVRNVTWPEGRWVLVDEVMAGLDRGARRDLNPCA